MANRTDSRRLDELVKQTLSNYESAATASDWPKMENLLGAAPKIVAPSFKFPSLGVSGEGAGFLKSIFSSYIFIVVLMLAGGGYLLYTILKAPKQDVKVTAAPPSDSALSKTDVGPAVISNAMPPENKTTEVITPELNKDSVAAVKSEPAKEEKKAELEAEKKETKEEREKREAKEAKEKKEAELTEKKEKERKEKIEADKLKSEKKKEEAKKAEKEKKEKERLAKEKEKKEAPKETLKKSNNPVGLNFLRSVNLDSLKKQQSQEQPVQPQPEPTKDTVKG